MLPWFRIIIQQRTEDSRWIDDGQTVALFFSLDQRHAIALSTCLRFRVSGD